MGTEPMTDGEKRMEHRLSALESGLAGLNVSVQSLTSAMQAVIAKMDRFDNAVQSIIRIEERNAGHKAALERAFDRLDAIENDIAQHKDYDAETHKKEAERVEDIEKLLARNEGFLKGATVAATIAWTLMGGIIIWFASKLGDKITIGIG